MEIVLGLFLGMVQGITEWIPISSEGVISLTLITFFHRTLQSAVYFSIWLHFGTLLAAMVYFRKEMKQIFLDLKTFKQDTTRFLFIATTITILIGVPLLFSLSSLSANIAMLVIGFLLILTGVLQRKRDGKRKDRRKGGAGG